MHKEAKGKNTKGISLKLFGLFISTFSLTISFLLVLTLFLVSHENSLVNEATANYVTLQNSSADVQLASDYLTAQVRLFVANADMKYMDNYFIEAKITKRRENALETIHNLSETTSRHEEIHYHMTEAVNESNNLMNLEYYAMKLICVDQGISYASYSEVANADISGVAPEDYKKTALNSVLGPEYMSKKEIITSHVDKALEVIDELMGENTKQAKQYLKNLIIFQAAVIAANVVFVAIAITLLHVYIVAPMNAAVKNVENNEQIQVNASREFNYLVNAYNKAHEQNERVKEKLIYEAEHDKLTGLFNRTGYDSLYRRMDLSTTIYILLDVDKFKMVNDQYGHEIGDKVLIRTAKTISKFFNEDNEYIFRLGGDEFAILVESPEIEICEVLMDKAKKVNAELSKTKGSVPGSTLSIGIARGDESDTMDSLFKKADKALYKVKQSGRGDVVLYE